MPGVLDGKVAIVTGAGRGIGRGIALLMAHEGAKVVVNDSGSNIDGTGHSQAPADGVVKEIHAAGGTAMANYETVSTMQGGESLIKTALNNYGKLDIVMTAHGIRQDRTIFDITEAEWDEVITSHLRGTFIMVHQASMIFRQQRSGVFITFSSEAGFFGHSGQANFAAAKNAIGGLTKVAARDLGRYSVRVNSIAPDSSDGTTGNPDDVAPFAVYLASDFASTVNGQTFQASGGTISLLSQPRQMKTLFKPTRWTVEELDPLCRDYLTKDIVNPAPAKAARK